MKEAGWPVQPTGPPADGAAKRSARHLQLQQLPGVAQAQRSSRGEVSLYTGARLEPSAKHTPGHRKVLLSVEKNPHLGQRLAPALCPWPLPTGALPPSPNESALIQGHAGGGRDRLRVESATPKASLYLWTVPLGGWHGDLKSQPLAGDNSGFGTLGSQLPQQPRGACFTEIPLSLPSSQLGVSLQIFTQSNLCFPRTKQNSTSAVL